MCIKSKWEITFLGERIPQIPTFYFLFLPLQAILTSVIKKSGIVTDTAVGLTSFSRNFHEKFYTLSSSVQFFIAYF